MPMINVKDLDGNIKTVDANTDHTLMEVLVDADYDDIEAICGGCCACATCHVYIGEDWINRLEPRNHDELMLLESVDSYNDDASRLSCQIQIDDEMEGLEVEIAPPE